MLQLDGTHFDVELPGARGLFTTRQGGVSEGPYESLNLGLGTDDEPECVRRNRRRVVDAADAALAAPHQVHGARVVEADTEPRPEADGVCTDRHGIAPAVVVADCLPVLLAAPGAVVALHCGWRGLAQEIVAEGVRALRAIGADGPAAAAIGPGARVCCYEVGEEVHAAFAHHGEGVRRGSHLDLAAVARRDLAAAGVERVDDLGLCTMCEPALFFSHRRDSGVTGRQMGVVWRT